MQSLKSVDWQNGKTPLVAATIRFLGLPSQSIADTTILISLVAPDEVDLALNSHGSILMGGKPLGGRFLQLGHQLVGVGDEGVHQVLAVDGLEMATV